MIMEKRMNFAGSLHFIYDSANGRADFRRLKSKTLKGMFAEAQRIISKLDKSKFEKITLTYAIVFAPVPSYAGDCRFNDFLLFDRKIETKRRLI